MRSGRERSLTEIRTRIGEALVRVRNERPLIHHITNLVVMNDTANMTLLLGALPVMGHASEEIVEMVAQADALLLNLGTPTPLRLGSMLIAGREANARGIPVILDPVGVGATQFRTESCLRLLSELDVAILRGNAGEIASLSTASGLSQGSAPRGRRMVRGVESVAGGHDTVSLAQAVARGLGLTVAITGPGDIVSDGRRILRIDNGHPLLTAITGTGGMATTGIAAFAAVEDDYVVAAAGGLACLGVAAELAAREARGPASFKVALFDRIHSLTSEQLAEQARISEGEAT